MKYTLNVLSSPYSGQTADTAYRFACSAIERGHNIFRVFFFNEGVYNGNALSIAPQDEQDKVQRWSDLAKAHNIDLVICVASALKRGVLNQQEAERAEKQHFNMAEGFEISGLGQLVEACSESDRVITFGG